jgi:ATP/maltotriose-dependent transcriptional regulator MalT
VEGNVNNPVAQQDSVTALDIVLEPDATMLEQASTVKPACSVSTHRASARRGPMLVCALAGSGKTVLLRSWIDHANLGDHTGWASVEHDERDAQRFWWS